MLFQNLKFNNMGRMFEKDFGIPEVMNLLNATEHYKQIYTCYFGDWRRDHPVLEEFLKEKIFPENRKYIDASFYNYSWMDFEIHILNQSWGSTAGGWPGMGGASISSYQTIVIENTLLKFACIYWSGKFAYMVKIDDMYKEYFLRRKYELPGLSHKGKANGLTVLYANLKQR